MKTSFDPLALPFPSRRYPVYARGGMVCCSVPQASSAGLAVLLKGGNAMDAAVAAAAALTVTEPTANGIGSDAFAIIWSEKDRMLYGLNSSGCAPMLISAGKVRENGQAENGQMPAHGWTPVTVPGAPAAWAAINGRFGTLSLAEALSPAVKYARDGYPCSPNLARMWQKAFSLYRKKFMEPCYKAWFDTFAPGGKTPEAGDLIYLKDHADTLEEIGRTNAASFYEGALARRIDDESRSFGGYLRYEDLAAHEAQWVLPLRVNYRGYEVCEIPPNGQGIVALMALTVLRHFHFPERESAKTVHYQIEAVKMAFADAFRYVTDPSDMTVDPASLLTEEYGAAMAEKMTDRAQIYTRALPVKSGTVYLCCADGDGNMVSYIQSNYNGFGSGIVVGGTGIALQNRGADFSLDPSHANFLRPGKKSYHTIIPGFLMKDGAPVGPFGVMGAYMQPQGHVQVAMNYIDFCMNPQQALDAPRWQWMRNGSVALEKTFSPVLAEKLRKREHDIYTEPATESFGRGQMIVRLANGTLVGGTEMRTDSNIACF